MVLLFFVKYNYIKNGVAYLSTCVKWMILPYILLLYKFYSILLSILLNIYLVNINIILRSSQNYYNNA
jgi:hypothetical protein